MGELEQSIAAAFIDKDPTGPHRAEGAETPGRGNAGPGMEGAEYDAMVRGMERRLRGEDDEYRRLQEADTSVAHGSILGALGAELDEAKTAGEHEAEIELRRRINNLLGDDPNQE